MEQSLAEIAAGVCMGDQLRLQIDLGTLHGPDVPNEVSGTFMGYNATFGAWMLNTEDLGRITVLDSWITAVHTGETV